MKNYSAIAAIAFTAIAVSASATLPAFAGSKMKARAATPAIAASKTMSGAAAAPVCQFGFQTIEKKSWILKCRKTAAMTYKGVLLTEANNANCTPNSYWNFGPKVSAKHLNGNTVVQVEYMCGHVEG